MSNQDSNDVTELPDHNPSLRDARKMFETGKGSDVQVKCKDRVWRVHWNYLSKRVDLFGEMQRLRTREWADNVINLGNERPSAVHAMLQYIYTFDYDYKYDSEYPFDVVGNGDKVLRESHFCLLDLFVRETACRHGLEGLQQVATNRFVEHVSSVSDPEVLSHVVKIVYGSGGGDEADLRGPVTRTIFNNARELFWIPCGTSFITAATGEPELCLDIIRGLVGKLQHCADSMMWKQGRWYYKCPFKCGFEFFSDKLALHRQFACPKCHGTQDGWMWNEYGTCVEVSPDDD